MRATLALAAAALAAAAAPARADEPLRGEIDRLARAALADKGDASISIAVVRDGKVSYAQAYGDARLAAPRVAATPAMRWSIGSNSKQFTAAAMLLLAEDGKLSIDDPVGKYLPDLTRAGEVTIRQLLSHTAGYQDYWPQDYLPTFMMEPTTPAAVAARWGKKPLDFEPGTDWQYSNTGYVIAGLIVEKVAGRPLGDLLRDRIFGPLGMKSVTDVDAAPLGPTDPTGYNRYALGPLRPAPHEGRGWLFAAGELAMTAEDLARWDIALMDRALLKSTSWAEMTREVMRKNGLGTRYGLGVMIDSQQGHRVVAHDGEISGFISMNLVFPDDRAAVVVLTSGTNASAIARKIAVLLLAGPAGGDVLEAQQRARDIFVGLQHGKLDRSLFTDDANAFFDAPTLKDFTTSLVPLGAPRELVQQQQRMRGGMMFRQYRVTGRGRAVVVWTRTMPDGKIEEYQVGPAD